MASPTDTILVSVFVLAAAIWIGGYVAIAVVAHIAVRTLPYVQRIAFFRSLGRSYGIVAGAGLIVALGTGAALVTDRAWDGALTAATTIAAALLLTTAVGVVQARRMTRLRRAAVQQPDDLALAGQIRHGARWASVLRAAIGLLSLALIALGSLLAT